MPINWKSNQLSRSVFEYKFNRSGIKNWEQWVFLFSDQHFDSPYCDRKLLKAHLDHARERDAVILAFGDWFDLMQGRQDRRSSKSSLLPQYKTSSYIDEVIAESAEFLKPYSDNIGVMGLGNHETSIIKHLETNPLERLVGLLNFGGAKIYSGGYAYWVRFRFHRNKGGDRSLVLRGDHGYGGGGPVTHDAIQHQRRQTFIDADFIVSGHTHTAWTKDVARMKMNKRGNIETTPVTHIKLGTYKKDYDEAGGFSIEHGHAPTVLGGYWIRFYADRVDNIYYDVIRAR